MDRITLYNIKMRPRIGVAAEERKEPQTCEGDLTLWLDLQAATTSDSLELSVDYCSVLEAVQQIAVSREYHLLETLAYKIVDDLLRRFPVKRVGLRLRKRPASLLDQLDYVEVEVEGT